MRAFSGGHPGRRGGLGLAVLLAGLVTAPFVSPGSARADLVPGGILPMKVQGPELRDRALEIGSAGAATLHLGTFGHGRVWLLAAELEPSFAHVPGSNLMDLEAAVSWFHPAAG